MSVASASIGHEPRTKSVLFDEWDTSHAGAPIPGETSGTISPYIPGSYFGAHEDGSPWSNIGTKSNGGMNPAIIHLVNTFNGNKLTGLPIVSWSSRGLTFVDFTLYHNSMALEYAPEGGGDPSSIGNKWTHSYNMYVTCADPGNGEVYAYVMWGDGLEIPFHYTGSNQTTHNYAGPPGVNAHLAFDGAAWSLKTKDQWSYVFGANGTPHNDKFFVTMISDRFQNFVEVNRPGLAHIVETVEDSAGRVLDLLYDYTAPMDPKMTGVTTPDGRTWTFTHDNFKFRVHYPQIGTDQPIRQFYYETMTGGASHNIEMEQDLRGNWWYYDYDVNQLTKAANPYGAQINNGQITWSSYWSYTYNATNTVVTDPKAFTTVYNYSNGQLSSSTDETNLSESYEHDARRNLTKLTDRRSFEWDYTFDGSGNLLTAKNPNLETTTFTYNGLNDIVSVKDNLNHTTTYSYTTSFGHDVLEKVTDGNGHVAVRYEEYDQHGQPLRVRDHYDTANREIRIDYDAFGNATDMTSGSGVVFTHNVYSPTHGLFLTQSTEPGIDPVNYLYDSWGRLTEAWQTSTFDGVKLTLDHEGLTTEVKNQLNRVWTSSYDYAMRLTWTKNPLNEQITHWYDSDDTVTQIMNARGYSRYFEYTNRGEVKTQTLADGTFDAWEYWPTGQVKSKRDGSMGVNQKIQFGYRNGGELLSIDYPDTTGDVLNEYDSGGRLDKVYVDGILKADYLYDAADQILQQVTPEGTVENVYLPDGQLEYLKDIGVGTGETYYEYDTYGRLWRLTNPHSEVTTFHYEATTDRFYKKVNHNGTFDETIFDNKGRPWKVFTRLTAGGNNPFQRTYTYYLDNKVKTLTDNYNQSVDVETLYEYDAAGHLTLESRPGYVVSYDYDANGNRWHRTKNGDVETYVCDAADKLTSMSDTNGFSRIFTYDAAGRMTTDVRMFGTTPVDSRVYTWNQGGRLINHTSSLTGQNQADGYNAAGARVSSTPFGQQPTLYRRAGLGVLAPEVSEWKNGSQVVSYTSGVSERRGSTSTWSHSGMKNFDYQSKSNSAVSSARRYDAFGDGQTQVSGSYWRGPWGYGGQFGYYSTNYGPQLIGMETGFTPTEPIKQIGHRWYDPSIGRFLSADPSEQGRNWFTYCANDPIGMADPDGLKMTSLAMGFAMWAARQPWWVQRAIFGSVAACQAAAQKARDFLAGGGGPVVRETADEVVEGGKQVLQKAATLAEQTIGGRGPVSGTLKHSFVKKVVEQGGVGRAEVSYLNRVEVPYGTKGSVRIDALFGNQPFDLKFGSANLSPSRLADMAKHLPEEFLPPKVIRP